MEPSARPRMRTVVEESSTTSPVNPVASPISEPQIAPVLQTAAPTPQAPMQSKPPSPLKKLMFIFPAALLLSTLLIAGYVTKKVFAPKPTPTPTPTQQPELLPATPVPTPKPLIKPKTYINSKLSFSLQYSGELVLTECANALHFTPEKDGPLERACESGALGVISLVWKDELSLNEFGGNYTVAEDYVKVGGLDGTRQIAIKKEGNGPDYEGVVRFSDEVNYFTLTVTKKDYEEEFNSIMQSFKVIRENPTENWELYSNTTYRYSLKHPEEWTATISATEKTKQTVELAKEPNPKDLHTLVIESTINVTNAQISASDIASSTRNLSGWRSPPSVDLRTIGGGAAQVIQGQFDSNWQVFVVVWFKNRIIQMSWVDALDRVEQDTFDNILSTFTLLP